MAYGHGITVIEAPTNLVPPNSLQSALPVVIGTAPVNMVATSVVNIPILVSSISDVENIFGYSDEFDQYTLSEFAKAYFDLYQMGPAVFINVLDPTVHKKAVASLEVTVVKNKAVIEQTGVILSTVLVKNKTLVLVKDTDYALSFDYRGYLVVTALSGGTMAALSTVNIEFSRLDATMVGSDDIIGSIDSVTGKKTGLELINDVFPKLRVIPTSIVAPQYSSDPSVANMMSIKAKNINGHFKAVALIDAPSDTITKHTAVAGWKETNNIMAINQFICWPKVSYQNKQYHLSSHLAGVIAYTDYWKGEGIPYISPSNKPLKIDKSVLENNAEVYLGPDEANTMNADGIVTALNFVGGWKAWGNRTAYYQQVASLTDQAIEAKDTFIPVRRMFNWINNKIITDCWEDVDNPMNKRLVDSFVDKINIWFNGLTSIGAILGGRIEIFTGDNPTENLMNGKLKFRVYVTPPSPAEEITFVVEYDPDYIGSILV